ncbi:MAG: hypothetical protein EHM23_08630 [Acidobacteria bacterium]|nr:MAG: hypothetical protein EHM23_08630 [Acidobacteriota bacterium]
MVWRFYVLALTSFAFQGLVAASNQMFRDSVPSRLEIRNYPLSAVNNSGTEYRFVLTVLGADQEQDFLPLLAIGARETDNGQSHWLALWNLSSTSPSAWQRLRAAIGIPGKPKDGRFPALSPDDFPEPCLSIRSLRAGTWGRIRWKALHSALEYSGQISPARFAIRNYANSGADLRERRFYQIYTLLELYESISRVAPSPGDVPVSQIMEIKFHLLADRKTSGLFLPGEAQNDVVQHFESRMRAQMGNAASYLHSNANLYRLSLKEIDFGLPGQVPVCRGALLSIRRSSLPARLPKWPRHNPFDLSYNPYEKPEIRKLMDQFPDEEIPLALYVLSSENRLTPILVADFFKRSNGIYRESSRVWRVTLDNAVELASVPLLYRALARVTGYALNKKDQALFNRRSTAAGVEPARIFARLDWISDPDTSDLLLKALDKRRANPLADSARREDQAARIRLDSLLADGSELSVFLRRLFEDEVRAVLKLGRRAVFDPDLLRFDEELNYLEALRVIRQVSKDPNLPAQSWQRILGAWTIVTSRGEGRSTDARRFLDRLRRMQLSDIPSSLSTTRENCVD